MLAAVRILSSRKLETPTAWVRPFWAQVASPRTNASLLQDWVRNPGQCIWYRPMEPTPSLVKLPLQATAKWVSLLLVIPATSKSCLLGSRLSGVQLLSQHPSPNILMSLQLFDSFFDKTNKANQVYVLLVMKGRGRKDSMEWIAVAFIALQVWGSHERKKTLA